jgi:Arc/MetJ-type ribon-helix-helix transcriptional regulator
MARLEIQLADDIDLLIEQEVVAGRSLSKADFVSEAVRRYLEERASEPEVLAAAQEGIADIEAGRFTLVSSDQDVENLRVHAMERVRERLANPR